jgi:hypothetical protein
MSWRQRLLAIGTDAGRVALGDVVRLPALEEGMGLAQMLEEIFLPVDRIDRPLAGVLAEHRTRMEGEILGEWLIEMLGQDIGISRIEIDAARREENVVAQLALIARVDILPLFAAHVGAGNATEALRVFTQ